MLLETLDRVSADLLRKLCDDRCPESDTLDFKRELPGGLDKDKHELLKDVCSLANTDGGDLVYGVEEKAGAASALVPLTGESADAARRRISQILDAGLEPRVQGLRLHHVEVTGGYVLILRVPASFDGPHCVRTNNNRRFVMRNGTSATDLTFDQLRAAFDRTATLAERARRFIARRLQLVIDHKTPKPLLVGPLWVVHLVPVAGLAGRQTVDLNA
ncbi:MAG: AlbA family DNA-binding domain-containing protein, partial [Gammaproteobacteria bacterium]